MRTRAIQILLVAGAILSFNDALIACEDFPSKNFESPETVVNGLYYNCVYGYEVRLEPHISGYGSFPPAPDHGFGVLLSRTPKSYIWIDGSYISEEGPLSEAVDEHIRWVKERGTEVTVEMREDLKLASLKAQRFRVRYKCKDSNTVEIEEYILASRGSILYTIAFMADPSVYSQTRKTSDKLVTSFRLRKLPCPLDAVQMK